ncbi:p53 induced protein [Holotrichia oblita]|uniref:P53 induced protein n=3 Tax=Holotrichia oblita TaxID=644536 RepID=A0ACB9T7I5_HOLOL|nr:p53 induced protein [Holotrichia oblita]KAI4462754.1 p53 induced protein [Holotrichia oblita]KAI4462760.1 p53 induced protein [Holotrichia oblita]
MDIKSYITAVGRGFFDSFKGIRTLFTMDKEMNDRMLSRLSPSHTTTPIRRRTSDIQDNTPVRALKKHEESKVLSRTIQCCFFNGGTFLFSIILFEYGLLPFINFVLQFIFGKESFMGKIVWSWIEPMLSIIFKTIWVLPLFVLSKIVNCLWFQDIADTAYRYSRGRPQFMLSLSKLLADLIFSIVVQALFLVQAMLVEYIPIFWVGYCLSVIHMSLLYSLYAFEYKWINMGWELHHRLSYIETNWPYFIGFGLPLTIFTQIPESCIISACIFSITFPIFIISANEASPITGICDYPMHLFSPVIKVSNFMLNRTIGTKKPMAAPTKPHVR